MARASRAVRRAAIFGFWTGLLAVAGGTGAGAVGGVLGTKTPGTEVWRRCWAGGLLTEGMGWDPGATVRREIESGLWSPGW